MSTIRVEASCRDARGGADGAYDLIGTWGIEAFCSVLQNLLKEDDWGLTNAEGPVTLNITIERFDPDKTMENVPVRNGEPRRAEPSLSEVAADALRAANRTTLTLPEAVEGLSRCLRWYRDHGHDPAAKVQPAAVQVWAHLVHTRALNLARGVARAIAECRREVFVGE